MAAKPITILSYRDSCYNRLTSISTQEGLLLWQESLLQLHIIGIPATVVIQLFLLKRVCCVQGKPITISPNRKSCHRNYEQTVKVTDSCT